MITSRDGVSLRQVREILDYMAKPESHFLFELKPEGGAQPRIKNYHEASAIRILKLEEYVHTDTGTFGNKTLSRRFRIKVLVEDRYFQKNPEKETFFESGIVPASIHMQVAEILSRKV